MRSSIAVSSALFAVAMAQGYSQPPPPAYGQSTTVMPQEYSTYLPEATTLCVDSTSTITVTCPTTITLTRMQTYTWSAYTTASCDESPEETDTAYPVETETETLPPCPESTTMASYPSPTGGSYPPPPAANNTSAAAVPVATQTGYVSGAGRSTIASGALVAVVGFAALFL